MGIFSGPNPFDGVVEKITDAKNTAEDWGMIMDMCDQVHSCRNGPKDCLKAIVRRLNHQDPHVVIQALILLDACVNNCGKEFRLEIASREFETEFRRLLSKSHPKVQERLRGMLKTWAEGEFKNDSQLSLIPGLYNGLKKEGVDFSSTSDQPKKAVIPKDPNVVSSQEEEDDIARAIQLSLQENKGSPKTASGGSGSGGASALYPSNSLYGTAASAAAASAIGGSPSDASSPKKDEKRARALYDFEAAEDNELTFKAGEIVIIIDDSDANWWKGSNHRGVGLFPANFVTKDLQAEPEQFKEEKQRRRSVQFNEEVEVKNVENISHEEVEISEAKIDTVMRLLHEADPTSPEQDAPELPRLEDQVNQMGPLIDAELEAVDRRHAQLTRLSTELVDALNLYHQLMHEAPPTATAYGFPPGVAPGGYGMPPMYMPGPQFNGYYPTAGPPMMGYPQQQQTDPQMYAGSAPPPPTPPLAEQGAVQHSTQHFTSPPQSSSSAPPPNFGMNGGLPTVAGSGYNNQMPQM